MKRHEALVPLSREHHTALILCQLLKNSVPHYKGLPAGVLDKAGYALNIFNTVLQPHFMKEEILLSKVRSCSAELDIISGEIVNEHEQLTAAFLALSNKTDLELALNNLGEALDKHIRKEERQLFPLIEQHCSGKLLDEIKDILN